MRGLRTQFAPEKESKKGEKVGKDRRVLTASHKPTRRRWAAGVFCLLIAACGTPALETADVEQAFAASQPNILLIVADDLGYTDLGAFGGADIATPNLDALARGGLRLTNFHAGPSCAPTRAMLMTGTDHHLAGMGSQSGLATQRQAESRAYRNSLLPEVPTIAELLKAQGYGTFASAKWHLGREAEALPGARGFDRSFVLLEGGAGHFDETPLFESYEASWLEDDQRVALPTEFYSSDHMTDKIMEYIAGGDENQPFFAYLGFTAPHWPLQAPEAALKKYAASYAGGWAQLGQSRLAGARREGVVPAHAQPVWFEPGVEDWADQSAEEQMIEAAKMAAYAAMVDVMDVNVGRLLAFLAERGQLENTLIVFTADNGAEAHIMENYRTNPTWIPANFDNSLASIGTRNSYVTLGPSWARATAIPFRDSKSKVTEGGIRVPAFVNWGGSSGTKTGVDTSYMRVMDLAPTFLEVAGGDRLPAMKGRSLLARWQGGDSPYGANEYIAGETYGRRYVRQGNWKAILQGQPYGTNEWQLYDLSNDLGEQVDLADEEVDRLAAMVTAWERYAEDVGVLLPETPILY